ERVRNDTNIGIQRLVYLRVAAQDKVEMSGRPRAFGRSLGAVRYVAGPKVRHHCTDLRPVWRRSAVGSASDVRHACGSPPRCSHDGGAILRWWRGDRAAGWNRRDWSRSCAWNPEAAEAGDQDDGRE